MLEKGMIYLIDGKDKGILREGADPLPYGTVVVWTFYGRDEERDGINR
jgi:hypothetical protein